MKTKFAKQMGILIVAVTATFLTLASTTTTIAAKVKGDQLVVVRRDITAESGCMYGDDGQTPIPCPANTVRQSYVIKETEAREKGEAYVKVNADTSAEVDSALKQLNELTKDRQPETTQNSSSYNKGTGSVMKPANQSCNNASSSIFFFTTFPSPSTTVKYTTTFFRTYLNGGCNGRQVQNLYSNLYSGPNVYINEVSWSDIAGLYRPWTGFAGCKLLPYTATFPSNVTWDKSVGYVTAKIYRNSCGVLNQSSQTSWQLP